MDISIEPAAAHNVDQLIRMLLDLARYERLKGPDADAQRRLRADVLAADPRIEAYLAVADGEPAGCFTCYEAYSTFLGMPTLFLEDLFVAEPFRREGVGQRLFDFCVAIAHERGFGRVEWQVLNWNESAIRFYQKNGARVLDDWGWWVLDPPR